MLNKKLSNKTNLKPHKKELKEFRREHYDKALPYLTERENPLGKNRLKKRERKCL